MAKEPRTRVVEKRRAESLFITKSPGTNVDGYGESSAAMAAGTDNILDLVDFDAPEPIYKRIDEFFASA